MHLSDILNETVLEQKINEGLINKKKHEQLDLYIYNYAKIAQATPGAFYNHEVKTCRGLITDAEGFIVSRPLPKFHNLIEHTLSEQNGPNEFGSLAPIPVGEKFTVNEKLDGSLGVLYPDRDGKYAIATRGSFQSPMAVWATKHLQENYPDFKPVDGFSYLFEIIYPGSRVVVSYEFQDLVLLTVIDNETGTDVPLPASWPGRVAKTYNFDSFEAVKAVDRTDPEGSKNSEGYVIRFENGLRVKVKFAEYVSLHAAASQLSTKIVYEYAAVKNLRDNFPLFKVELVTNVARGSIDAAYNSDKDPLVLLYSVLPDEILPAVEKYVLKLENEVHELRVKHQNYFDEFVKPLPSKRDKAKQIVEVTSKRKDLLSGALFSLLNGEVPDATYWHEIQPEYSKILN